VEQSFLALMPSAVPRLVAKAQPNPSVAVRGSTQATSSLHSAACVHIYW